MALVPYKNNQSGKKEQISQMFDNISGNYDFLNRLLSAGVDIGWRKKALRELQSLKPSYILDVATGTADFALMSYKMLSPSKIMGVDISEGMLEIGRSKVKDAGLNEVINLKYGDSENLQFEQDTFDALTVAYGVRNFENLDKGLKEFHRVIKPGGKVVILEFSKPQAPFKYFFNFYFKYILPNIGRIVSKDFAAYSYLQESVQQFPSGEAFLTRLKEAGFKDTKWKQLTFGVSSIYTGIK